MNIPHLKKFLHLVAKAQWVVGLYQTRKNKKNTNNEAADIDNKLQHMSFEMENGLRIIFVSNFTCVFAFCNQY